MKNNSVEIIVGLFVVVVFVVLGWLTTQMGKFSFKSKPVYTIYAPFDNIAGLDVNTKVKVAGVDVGVIKSIQLEKGKAVVEMAIFNKYKIPKDSTALIKSKSLLGDKFLEIRFGKSNEYLKNGDFLTNTESATDIGTLVNNVNKIFSNQQNGNAGLIQAITKISELAENLNSIVQENRETLKVAIAQTKSAMENFNASMKIIKTLVQENKKDVRLAVENARMSMEKLNQTLDNLYFMTSNMRNGKGTIGKLVSDDSLYNNLNNASSSLNNIGKKIDSGEGTIGKLVNDDAVYNNLNDTLKYIKRYLTKANRILINVSARNEYRFRDKNSKGKIYADIYTMPDKFYRVGLTDETDHSEDINGSKDNKMRLTALMGKRYYNFTLRGGIIESTFGFGVDYTPFDNLKFSVDAFDFNHDNDIRDTNAQLRAELVYTFLRHFSVFGGVDEILNPKTRSVYAGAGMEFSNDDLKYFIDKVPTGAFSK